MTCALSCGIVPDEHYDATVYDYHQHPMPLMRVSIPGTGVRNIWFASDNPPPVGTPIKVKYSRRYGWELEEIPCED